MNGERGRVPVVTGDLKTEGGVLHDRRLHVCEHHHGNNHQSRRLK